MFRARKWDGYVYLFNNDSGKIYSGLKQEVYRFANDREYKIKDYTVSENSIITNEDYFQFLTSFPCEYKLRDYQSSAVRYAIDKQRCLLLSPTASGKSLISYLL